MQDNKFLSREKTQALIDGLRIKQSEGKAFLDGLAAKGYTIQGFNDQPKPEEKGFLDKIGQEAKRLSSEYQRNVGEAQARQARGEQTGLETAAQTFGEAARGGVSTLLSPLTVGVGEALNATGVTQDAEERAKATQAYIAEQKAINPNYNPETDPKLNPFTAGVVQSAQNSPYQERQLSEREKANMGIFTNVGGAAMDVAGALEGVGALKTAAGATAKGIASGAKATIAAGKDLPGSIKNITKSINDIGRTPKTLEGVVGEIAQGTTETINPVKTALGVVDTSKVNTYSDLLGQINKTIPEIATKVDSEFLKDTTRYTLDDLAVKQATKGGTKVSTDYVSKGLNELKDFYTAVGDDVAKTDIEDLITKAKTEGLTRKEVNDIARLHGRELNAYNANGQLASGLTKQAVENTRQGLKNTARQGIGEEAKNLDSQLSALYDTQKLIEKNVERVNKLQQLVQDRGLIEKVGYNFAKYADILTGGTLRGAIGGLLPRGAGYKTMNALDLEEKLRDNLNIVEKALKSKTDKELIDNLNQLKSSAETSARSNSSLVKNTTNSTKATTKNVIMKETIPQTTKGASGKKK